MTDSPEEIQREFEEFEQSESSLDSGLESAPARNKVPPWIKWMVVADLVIIAVVFLIFFAT